MTAREGSRKSRSSDRRPLEAAPGASSPREVPSSLPTPNAAATTPLGLLLGLERQARHCASLTELRQLIANESRKLNRAKQITIADIGADGAVRISAISSISSFDSSSMLIVELSRLLERVGKEHSLSQRVEFTLPAYCESGSDLAVAYPFRELAWVPFVDRRGVAFAGMLLARESIWTSDDLAIAHRLGEVFEHAWRELSPPVQPRWTKPRRWKSALAVGAVLALAIPFPMTALAPVEIVALEPAIVSAPIDGVIDIIVVDPGATVKAGDVLLRYSDTMLRNRRDLAAREVAVAQARIKQQTLIAFGDVRGRHELSVAEADLALKRAELAFADELLARSVVRSPRAGIAIYADRKSLIGRPVSTGEHLMEIAAPDKVESRIDVAMTDAVALKSGAGVKLYLDVDPLRPWSGRITRSDYRARPSDTDVLSIRAFAALDPGGQANPRIGLRGTAQVYGDLAPLGVVIFRRPLSAARQWLGL